LIFFTLDRCFGFVTTFDVNEESWCLNRFEMCNWVYVVATLVLIDM
jgi:hypothetical protein